MTRILICLTLFLGLLVSPSTALAYDCSLYNYTVNASGAVEVTNGEAVAEPATIAVLRLVNRQTRAYTNYILNVPALAAGESYHLLDVTPAPAMLWTVTPYTRTGGCSDSGVLP